MLANVERDFLYAWPDELDAIAAGLITHHVFPRPLPHEFGPEFYLRLRPVRYRLRQGVQLRFGFHLKRNVVKTDIFSTIEWLYR